MISFAKRKANHWLSRSDMTKEHCKSFALLWQYMAMLVQHNGVCTARVILLSYSMFVLLYAALSCVMLLGIAFYCLVLLSVAACFFCCSMLRYFAAFCIVL